MLQLNSCQKHHQAWLPSTIQLDHHEVEFNNNFKLFLHTKLTDPHSQSDIRTQTTVTNLTVTLEILEEQLLGNAVNHEKESLKGNRTALIRQMNKDKIINGRLKKDLLDRLQSPKDSLIADLDLISTFTKNTSDELTVRVEKAVETSQAR